MGCTPYRYLSMQMEQHRTIRRTDDEGCQKLNELISAATSSIANEIPHKINFPDTGTHEASAYQPWASSSQTPPLFDNRTRSRKTSRQQVSTPPQTYLNNNINGKRSRRRKSLDNGIPVGSSTSYNASYGETFDSESICTETITKSVEYTPGGTKGNVTSSVSVQESETKDSATSFDNDSKLCHNRRERERSRRISEHIQELREIMLVRLIKDVSHVFLPPCNLLFIIVIRAWGSETG